MIDNQAPANAGNQNNNGRPVEHLIYRTWAELPDASPNAPDINVTVTFDDTTYEVSTDPGVARMIHVFVTPPLGVANPWTCAQHCGILDITNINLYKIDNSVWAYVTYTDGSITRSLIAPFMEVCEDVDNN